MAERAAGGQALGGDVDAGDGATQAHGVGDGAQLRARRTAQVEHVLARLRVESGDRGARADVDPVDVAGAVSVAGGDLDVATQPKVAGQPRDRLAARAQLPLQLGLREAGPWAHTKVARHVGDAVVVDVDVVVAQEGEEGRREGVDGVGGEGEGRGAWLSGAGGGLARAGDC